MKWFIFCSAKKKLSIDLWWNLNPFTVNNIVVIILVTKKFSRTLNCVPIVVSIINELNRPKYCVKLCKFKSNSPNTSTESKKSSEDVSNPQKSNDSCSGKRSHSEISNSSFLNLWSAQGQILYLPITIALSVFIQSIQNGAFQSASIQFKSTDNLHPEEPQYDESHQIQCHQTDTTVIQQANQQTYLLDLQERWQKGECWNYRDYNERNRSIFFAATFLLSEVETIATHLYLH